MGLIVDTTINKTENLAKDMKAYDTLRGKTYEEQENVMVLEPGYQYGAVAFETYDQSKGSGSKIS